MRRRFITALPLLVIALTTAGCGTYLARRIAQSPNTYPQWFAPAARVQLGFDPNLLTNFTCHFADVGPPSARLRFRIVEPADFHLKFSATNWMVRGQPHFAFKFGSSLPGQSNAWTGSPRGTVMLLHGYGDGQFAMAPWALRLAEEGWRCVLVDLRGHGKSTGRRIYFGSQETQDLSRLLDVLAREGWGDRPVEVVGHSYGGVLALRWKTVEPRIGNVVAMAPYAVLSNVVLNIHDQYAGWLPRGVVKAGLRKLPRILKVEPAELDTATVLARSPVAALFAVGTEDRIAPTAGVRSLYTEAAPGSELVVVPQATHEALPYFFNELVPPVLRWLKFGERTVEVGSGPIREGFSPLTEDGVR
jgi:pimeloyl-ACP methyl ester carboxylesterase